MKTLLVSVYMMLATAIAAAQPAPAMPTTAAATAIFAGGCFWCVEADFEKLPGVIDVESGYIGGHVHNPSYVQVSTGTTGHTQAVRIRYDPSRVSYAQLLDHFWLNIDPTVENRQFCDIGPQYRSAIFYLDDAQRQAAQSSKSALLQSNRVPNVYTEINEASQFYPAEAYHQGYHKKNPIRYTFYRLTCGRDARLAELWGA